MYFIIFSIGVFHRTTLTLTYTDLKALRILLECIHVWFGSIEDFERGPAKKKGAVIVIAINRKGDVI